MTKIPAAKIRGWHSAIEKLVLVVVDSQDIAKKKRLVPHDGPADVAPIVVVHARRFRYGGLEERHRRQCADAVDFISSTMKLVRT